MDEGGDRDDSDTRIRTLDVTLQGGAPWGFSVKGGSEHRCPLTIARIEPGGKASQTGVLHIDDIILSINDVECESHTEAIQLVKGSPNSLHLIIQRSGSDLHLRQTMKQTDFFKAPIQDPVSLPEPVKKSQHIYDVQQAPSTQTYEKSGHIIYDVKKSPDYDYPPSNQAAVGGVARRLKKGEASNQSRPKSWHNADASQTWEEPAFKRPSKPAVAQPLHRPTPHLPSQQQHQAPPLDESQSMESLTVMQTYHTKSMHRGNTKSMMNLQGYNENEVELDPGFVKKRVSEYISSSNRELSSSGKEKDFYFVSRDKWDPLTPYNPKFRDVPLQPAETYPKVAMATQLRSAQQKAFIGRVPDAQTPPEAQSPTYSTSQVASYSRVQMPQRHFASTVELGGKYCDENTNSHPQRQGQLVSPTSGHPVYRAIPMKASSPTPSDKREPPTPPQRGDSRNRTHQMQSEHMKSSSWPVTVTETLESKRNDNNSTPSSIISPTDIPPVKLCSEPEQIRPNHRKTYSMTGDSEHSTYSVEPPRSTKSPIMYSSSSQLVFSREPSTGSETFPRMSSKKQENIFTAQPCYVDPGSEGPETDTSSSWYPNSSPQHVPEKHRSSQEYQPRGSPPTRDNVDKITEEKDPLVYALQSFMQTALDQEESLQGINPDSSSAGSESPTHQPHTYSTNRVPSQTLPAYVARNENEKRLSRTSVSSLESHSSSNNRMKSPTNRLSSDEEEQNRKNSQLGNANKRNWKNPNDFSPKKPVIDTNKKWEEVVLIADPTWGEKYPHTDTSSTQENLEELRSSSQIDEKLIRGNAPGMRSPISPLMMEAVTTIEPQHTEKIMETQKKEIQFLKAEGRDSGYEVEAENPFRSLQDSPDHISDMAKNFSPEDLMKLDKVDTVGGMSILFQLQKGEPFIQRYPINGDPTMKTTVNHETKVEIRIDKPYSSPTNESSRQMTRPQSSRPQPVYQPKSKEDFLKEMKSPPGHISKDAKNSFFGSQPQLSRQTGGDKSSRHNHSSSLDLDTRVSGPQVQSSFSPWKPEGSNESNTGVSHSRSHSYSGSLYSGYPGPSEPRFSRIDEEQTEPGPTSQNGNNQDQRSVMGSSLPRSYGSQDRDTKDHRRNSSEHKNPDPPSRKTSLERAKGHWGDLDYASQHQYSKSDSERHRRFSPADQCHNISDPSGAIRKSHRVSDPEDKRNIKDALMNFFHSKTGPQRSEGSVYGSQQGSLSDYASMQSLDQFSQYSSMSSLHGRRSGGMDSFDHSRQSSYSSNASHAHRDSGIVSPSESSWGPPSPNTSPPGVMDHRQRGQQRLPATDHNHQRTSSDSTSPGERVQDSNFHRNSLPGLDDSRLGKKSSKVNRSSSMSHVSKRRPISLHDARDRYLHKDDFSKGLSRTETFSMGQCPSTSHSRQLSQLSSTLPSTGYPDNNAKPHWASKDSNLRGPGKAAPSVDKSSSFQEPEADDVPPELPPKQVKEAQLKTIAKVDQIRPEESSDHKTHGERKASSPPAQSVFKFPSPTHADQPRHPSPKTSPTLPVKDTSPPAQGVNRPRSRTSPNLPSGQETTTSPTHQRAAEPHRRSSTSPGVPGSQGTTSPTHQQRRSSASLPSSKETSPTTTHPRAAGKPATSPSLPVGQGSISPTHPRRSSPPAPLPNSKETSPTHPFAPRSRSRTDSFDLPPPPTPPAFPITEVVHDLPPPPLEVLQDLPLFHREDKKAVEEPISHRQAVKTQAAVSHLLQGDQESNADRVSASVSPQTFSQQSPATAEGRLPEREGVVPVREGPVVDLIKDSLDVIDAGNLSDTPSSHSGINGSPISRRLALDLEADDEAGPIQVVEIIRTPTLSPKRSGHEEEHLLDPLVAWVLQSVNSQDFALRELFQFPEEPEKVGSPGQKKMPHGKKGEVQTPKRPECDVKSLTHALSSSLYLQISPAKALLLTKAKGMMGSDMVHGDSQELRKTKEELISRITRKVSELRKEKQELQEEINNIEDLGRQVTENVRESCKESSLDKYVMYIGDADRVTKLLLSLNRRLTKVKSVLNSLEGNDEEEQKADLQKMHKDLTSKYEDAKSLKASIDARHVQISSMLQDHLSAEEHEDFCHFVRMRSRLRIMAQELDDRITLGEEQLQALRDSMKEEGSQGEGSEQSLVSVCSFDSS